VQSKPSARLKVRVTPRSSFNSLEVKEDGAVCIWVSAPPADDQANQMVCQVLSKALHVPSSAISIEKGTRSREKKILILGLSELELTTALEPGISIRFL